MDRGTGNTRGRCRSGALLHRRGVERSLIVLFALILTALCSCEVRPPPVYQAPPEWEPRLVWELVDRPEAQVENDFHEVSGHTFPLRGMHFQESIYFFDMRGEIEEIVPSSEWAEVSTDGQTILTRGYSGAFKLWSRSGELLWERQDFDHGALNPAGEYAVLEDGSETLVIARSGDTLASYEFGLGRPVFSSAGDVMFAKIYREHLRGEGVALFGSSGNIVYTDTFEKLIVGGLSISRDGSRAAYLSKPPMSDLVFVRSMDSEGLVQWEDTISADYYGCRLSEDGDYLLVFGEDVACYDNWTGSILWEYTRAPEDANLYFEGASAMETPDLFALTLVSDSGIRASLVILGSRGEVFWKGAIVSGDYWKPRFHQNEQLLAIYGERSYLLYDLRGLEHATR